MLNQNTTTIESSKLERRGTRLPNPDAPSCLRCKKRMHSHEGGNNRNHWRCHCGREVLKSVTNYNLAKARRHTDSNAYCLRCRRQMRRTGRGRSAVFNFHCRGCGMWIQSVQTRPRIRLSGDELLQAIDSKIRDYSIEVREELRSEIALAILSKAKIAGERVTAATLTPATVRAIAKPIYKMLPNRFTEVSLDHQYDEDGQRLAERLVG